MHLKSLTVRGFKSFASATTFDFEPGVTAVVGPNGSGKSNVVDALAWVMGEQGAKTLRGGKMEDVIFAGTAGRPPLGRAHVSLTIDNSDGALPIEYSEVTISRTLFRTGGSEYAINGSSCRLLDIQELLSDSGLGREMHVIVGQGQLDKVLHATPEDRRGFMEEAAGILKHRRRKEKTVRKLEAMQANLQRLTDLTGEIRRQLTPLGKQAEVARRAQPVQFEVRDARARLLADDLVELSTSLAQEVADEAALKSRQAEVEKTLEAGRSRLAELEQLAAEATPKLNAARDTWYQLSSAPRTLPRPRLAWPRNDGGCSALPIGNRTAGRDPEQLEQQAGRVREEQAELELELEDRREALDDAIEARAAAERAAAGRGEAADQHPAGRRRPPRRSGQAGRPGGGGTLAGGVCPGGAGPAPRVDHRGRGTPPPRPGRVHRARIPGGRGGGRRGRPGRRLRGGQRRTGRDRSGTRALRADEREAERERDALGARKEALQSG